MDCPWCRSHLPDTATECPVCRKPLPNRPAEARVTLASEPYQGSLPPLPAMSPGGWMPEDRPATPPPTAWFPPVRKLQPRQDLRWGIVIVAGAAILICLGLLLWPPLFLPILDGHLTPYKIAPVFSVLFIGYAILAFLTITFLPAPWVSGWLFPWRRNWVLFVTGYLGVFLFSVVALSQIANEIRGEHVEHHNDGYAVYTQLTRVREISAEEYQRMRAEADRRLMTNLSRAAAGTLLLWYAGIAGYGAWWLLARPGWRHPVHLGEGNGDRL